MSILGELIIVTDEDSVPNHAGTNIYIQDEYDGRDTNKLNEICQQSTAGRLPQYKGRYKSIPIEYDLLFTMMLNLYKVYKSHQQRELIRHIREYLEVSNPFADTRVV